MQFAKTFRVFVSSTFVDLVEERNALQRYVWPELKRRCKRENFHFQAIDLRWGISSEAGLDQRTTRICLEELRRCQDISPRPNFVILLGDRYGWCPLPESINAEDFKSIELIAAELGLRDRMLLRDWYRLDTNSVPASYYLRPRAPRTDEAEGPWWHEKVERPLRMLFLRCLDALWHLDDPRRIDFERSLTEREILAGALNPPASDALDHVFAYFRNVDYFNTVTRVEGPEANALQTFMDYDLATGFDKSARSMQLNLKQRLAATLGDRQIREYQASWNGTAVSLNHLDLLCDTVMNDLWSVIKSEIDSYSMKPPIEIEIAEHAEFGWYRGGADDQGRDRFHGRAELLDTISDYIHAIEINRPLIIHGPAGSGKSALMAKAAIEAKKTFPIVLQRFIGATAPSAEVRPLLQSLTAELGREFQNTTEAPLDYRELVAELHLRLSLATEERPIVLFVDALDQLSDADNALALFWFPHQLPKYVRLVASVLDDSIEAMDEVENKPVTNYDPWAVLKRRNKTGELLVRIGDYSSSDARSLLNYWMQESQRSLTADQEKLVLDAFAHCPRPLFLKLASEEAKRWHSGTQDIRVPIAAKPASMLSAMINQLFDRLSESSHHGSNLVERTVSYLVASQNGLTENELLDLLTTDQEFYNEFVEGARRINQPLPPGVDSLPVAVWVRLYSDLEPYLTNRLVDGTMVHAFYHRSISATARSRFLSDRRLQLARHTHAARQFERDSLAATSAWNHRKPRSLLEALHHWFNAQAVDQCHRLLTDLGYLRALIAGQGINSLLNAFDQVTAWTDTLPATVMTQQICQFRDFSRRWKKELQTNPDYIYFIAYNTSLRGAVSLAAHDTMSTVKRTWIERVNRGTDGDYMPRQLGGHGTVASFAVTRDYCLLATAYGGFGNNSGVVVIDILTGKQLHILGTTHKFSCVAISSDGRYIAAGRSQNGEILVWELETDTLLAQWQAHDLVVAIAFSPDSQRIASIGFEDLKLSVWSSLTGEQIFSWKSSRRILTDVTFSPNGTQVIVSGGTSDCLPENDSQQTVANRDEIHIFNLANAPPIHSVLRGHDGSITRIICDPIRQVLYSLGKDFTVRKWDIITGDCLDSRRFRGSPFRGDLTIEAGSETITIIDMVQGMTSWDTANKTIQRRTRIRGQRLVSLGENRFAVASIRDIFLVNVLDEIGADYVAYTGIVRKSFLSEEGVVIVREDSGPISVGEIPRPDASGPANLRLRSVEIENEDLWFCNDKTYCAVTYRGEISICKYSTVDDDPLTEVLRCSFSESNSRWIVSNDFKVAIAMSFQTLECWKLSVAGDTWNATLTNTFPNPQLSLQSVALTPDGSTLFALRENHSIVAFDVCTGEIRAVISELEKLKLCFHIALSPCARFLLATRMGRGNIFVWELLTGSLFQNLTGHGSHIRSLQFSACGRYLLSGDEDGIALLRCWPSGVLVAVYCAGSAISSLSVLTHKLSALIHTDDGQLHFCAVRKLAVEDQSTENVEKSPADQAREQFVVVGKQATLAAMVRSLNRCNVPLSAVAVIETPLKEVIHRAMSYLIADPSEPVQTGRSLRQSLNQANRACKELKKKAIREMDLERTSQIHSVIKFLLSLKLAVDVRLIGDSSDFSLLAIEAIGVLPGGKDKWSALTSDLERLLRHYQETLREMTTAQLHEGLNKN